MPPYAQSEENDRKVHRHLHRTLRFVDGRLPFRAAVRPHLAVAYRLGRRQRRVRPHAQARRQCDQGNRGYDGAAARLQVAGRLDSRGQHQVSGASGGRHALPDACQIPPTSRASTSTSTAASSTTTASGTATCSTATCDGAAWSSSTSSTAAPSGRSRPSPPDRCATGSTTAPSTAGKSTCWHSPTSSSKSPDVWEDFLNPALPIAERQILYAGYRLAHVLNELFG